MSTYVSIGVVAFCIALAWLARLTLPLHRALRVRNAFLLRRGRREDFDWTPADVPAGFRLETSAPPQAIAEAVRESGALAKQDDWARALALVTMLVRHARAGGPVRADLTTTWRAIVAGSGYCADYVRVYMAAATAAGLFCRQWAFSFDGFGGHGHTFVEIFDRQRGRWAFIDVHNNVYAVATGSSIPLDALSLHEALLAPSPAIEFVRAGEGRLGYPHVHKLHDYYRNGAPQWYLWWGNDVIARSQTGLAGALGRVSGRLSHRFGAALLRVPSIVAWSGDANEHAIRRMEALRKRTCLAFAAVLASMAILVVAALWPAAAETARG